MLRSPQQGTDPPQPPRASRPAHPHAPVPLPALLATFVPASALQPTPNWVAAPTRPATKCPKKSQFGPHFAGSPARASFVIPADAGTQGPAPSAHLSHPCRIPATPCPGRRPTRPSRCPLRCAPPATRWNRMGQFGALFANSPVRAPFVIPVKHVPVKTGSGNPGAEGDSYGSPLSYGAHRNASKCIVNRRSRATPSRFVITRPCAYNGPQPYGRPPAAAGRGARPGVLEYRSIERCLKP